MPDFHEMAGGEDRDVFAVGSDGDVLNAVAVWVFEAGEDLAGVSVDEADRVVVEGDGEE